MIPVALLILVTYFSSLASSNAKSTTTTCTCWDGYRAEYSENGGSQCVAFNQFHIMPCNMPKAPKCQCSGRVSSILKDRTGTWCTQFYKGEELRRWPCENTQEWDEFFVKYPDFV